ncbi:DUF3135 domain-containing protein [Vibrio japonicus]|uniref:DUF3135 domain-containing protein n=1 Tax=Vibrio japonicus TaxID=1824638 RepID=A0ABY5LH93_9VIBR|nr:DUF3135 domain-containing protein [Vibrio japonicus]UUM30447.1 DUF3135 domain-containing protein [Vibrio japonicus]
MQANPSKHTLPSFDELVKLAEENPDAFDRLKRDMCKECIMSASESMQSRLWAQQSHIDLVISHCKNPNHVNVQLMKELVAQVRKFQDALTGEVEPESNADIVQFNDWR